MSVFPFTSESRNVPIYRDRRDIRREFFIIFLYSFIYYAEKAEFYNLSIVYFVLILYNKYMKIYIVKKRINFIMTLFCNTINQRLDPVYNF